MTDGPEDLRFSSLFDTSHVLCGMRTQGRDEAIRELVKCLAGAQVNINADEAAAEVIEREELLCTAVSPGLAIPHARFPSLQRMEVAIGTSEKGVDFGLHARGSVHLIVLILTPEAAPGAYLQAVAAVARFFTEPATARQVAGLKNAADVWRFFDKGEIVLPKFVTAHDMMNMHFYSLKDTDTLKAAIDHFAHCQVTEMPVVDDEGDLVGVIGAKEILRFCLPEHFLWLQDLSPILHFEPFAEAIKGEEQTRVADIMASVQAALPEEAPAVEVARVLMRTGVRQVMVLRGKRLVGIITLNHFVTKALRG